MNIGLIYVWFVFGHCPWSKLVCDEHKFSCHNSSLARHPSTDNKLARIDNLVEEPWHVDDRAYTGSCALLLMVVYPLTYLFNHHCYSCQLKKTLVMLSLSFSKYKSQHIDQSSRMIRQWSVRTSLTLPINTNNRVKSDMKRWLDELHWNRSLDKVTSSDY